MFRVSSIAVVLLLVGLVGCGSPLKASTEDYVDARKGFKTKLLKTGPSPQAQAMPKVPEFAIEVTYESGGNHIKAWESHPFEKQTEKSPAVVFLHGGFDFDTEDFVMAEPFYQAGFQVMVPLTRGEDGGEGSFSMFYDEVDDVIAAVRKFKERPDIDANRVYLVGHSVGGTHCLLAAMACKEFKAAASFSGSPDQFDFCKDPEWRDMVPFDKGDSREYQMRSPLAFPTSFKCPTRIMYGDSEVYFKSNSQKLATLAKKAGLDVEAVEVKGDHFTAVDGEIERAISFFNQMK